MAASNLLFLGRSLDFYVFINLFWVEGVLVMYILAHIADDLYDDIIICAFYDLLSLRNGS